MTPNHRFLLSLLLLLAVLSPALADVLSLGGTWQFQLDRADQGVRQAWFCRDLTDHILLPGSMPQRLKGDEVTVRTRWIGSLYDSSFFYNPAMEKYRRDGQVKLPFFLTPDRHYVGVAWYSRTVNVPTSWSGRHVVLFLERPHIETTLWVNGRLVGTQNSLTTAHEYDVTGFLCKGTNRLSLRIDNRIETTGVGQDSHSVTDQTQGDWNGIVGRMELQSGPQVYLDDVQVFPEVSQRQARVEMTLISATGRGKQKGQYTLSAFSFNSTVKHTVTPVSGPFTLEGDTTHLSVLLPMGDSVQLWDEFRPSLYRLRVSLKQGAEVSEREVTFGMRDFRTDGKLFTINGRPCQLRGTVENCDFPLTGYAPMDEASWERVFRICRSYGLNHMRFHSYCPPEAAFEAADIVGFYLQPEGPTWANHGVSLGRGEKGDAYVMEETRRMVRSYGNHPSFCMLCSGNEPRGNWVPWVSHFVQYWRARDNRRLYTGASVGGSWAWQPDNDYHVKAGARGLDWSRRAPQTMDDFSRAIANVKEPYVAHEMGQWCAFPDFSEIPLYTGVNKARNFEIFRDLLADHGMASMARKFLMASGKLQLLCYKYDVERLLRTPGYAGYQLLSLNDYSGQGTALVGVLNVFFGNKGYASPADFRRFCSPVVPLARFPKFVYQDSEHLSVAVEAVNYGASALPGALALYTLRGADGRVYAEDTLSRADLPLGSNLPLGTVSFDLSRVSAPSALTLEVKIKCGDSIRGDNDWDFWVYPHQVSTLAGDVLVTDTLDARALAHLSRGGKVLIEAAGRVRYGRDVKQSFTPVFWNTSWFQMRPPHTTGFYIDNSSPLFRHFPTEYYSQTQWWELVNDAQVMQMTEFPKDFQPLVQSIDTWHVSRKLGMLFEARVGGGSLLMTSMDLRSRPEHRIVARQLLSSVLSYMQSPDFHPTAVVAPEVVEHLFTRDAPSLQTFTHDAPDELKVKQKKQK